MTALAEREALRHSFPLSDTRFPWGTLFDQVAARYAPARVGTGGFLDVPCASVLDLGTIGATVYAPPRARPIHQLSYAIDEAAALHTEVGLARTLAGLEQRLGAGAREEHALAGSGDPAAKVRATVTWRFDPIALTLSAFGGVRTTARGRSTGGFFLSHRIEPLAAPFVARFRAAGALYDDPGVRESAALVHAAGLVPMGGQSFDTEEPWEVRVAFRASHLAAAPRWAREQLGPDEIAIARHPSGAWGLITRQAMWSTETAPASVELSLERVLPARGSGRAVLSTAAGETLLTTERGERGLDQVAERLRAIGVQVRVSESHDA
ncbi:MAG TPA: hypothetical protein VNM90_29945 [Haliangium sp.]|nr:hypothetical protein [Haliangium sp.]